MQNSNSHKGVELWAKSINDFGNFGRHFQCATFAKILAAMSTRVPQAMAQFVLKIEKLSHIMGPTPILEMARAYGLRPRLWLLVNAIFLCKFDLFSKSASWSPNLPKVSYLVSYYNTVGQIYQNSLRFRLNDGIECSRVFIR